MALPMTNDVLIIGAGLAGLAVARTLRQQSKRDVLVLEKSRGPGGRLASKRIGSTRADIGAQFMTARDPRFAGLLAEAEDAQAVATWCPVMGKLTADGLLHSPDRQARFVGAPYMNAFARYLAQNLPIQTEVRVDRISAGVSGWQVRTVSGTIYDARDVVITAPIEQLRDLLQETALAEPLLPFESDPTWSVVVESEATLRSQDGIPLDAAFGDGQWLDFISREGSRPGRDSAYWVCQAATPWTQAHLDAHPEEVATTFCHDINVRLGMDAKPVLAHRWRYARPKDPSLVAQKGAIELAKGLWACGDGFSGGRCEGAYLSGLEVASRLLMR